MEECGEAKPGLVRQQFDHYKAVDDLLDNAVVNGSLDIFRMCLEVIALL
jgi:hypothetical protein